MLVVGSAFVTISSGFDLKDSESIVGSVCSVQVHDRGFRFPFSGLEVDKLFRGFVVR